jgi:hypothetical protein
LPNSLASTPTTPDSTQSGCSPAQPDAAFQHHGRPSPRRHTAIRPARSSPTPQPAGQATLVRVARRHPRSDHPEPQADVGAGATVYRNLDPVQCVRAEARFEYQAAGKPIMPAPRHQEPPTRRTPSWLSTAQHSGPASSYRPAASTSVRAAADTGTKAPMSRATDSRRFPLTARAVAGFSNMPPSTAEPMRGSSAKKRGVFVLTFRPSDRRQQRTRSTE